MTPSTDTELDRQAGKFIFDFVVDRHTCQIGLLPCTYCEAKAQLKQLIARERLDELAIFKPEAESWVDKHYSYLGVNYLNRRYAALQAQADKGGQG